MIAGDHKVSHLTSHSNNSTRVVNARKKVSIFQDEFTIVVLFTPHLKVPVKTFSFLFVNGFSSKETQSSLLIMFIFTSSSAHWLTDWWGTFLC